MFCRQALSGCITIVWNTLYISCTTGVCTGPQLSGGGLCNGHILYSRSRREFCECYVMRLCEHTVNVHRNTPRLPVWSTSLVTLVYCVFIILSLHSPVPIFIWHWLWWYFWHSSPVRVLSRRSSFFSWHRCFSHSIRFQSSILAYFPAGCS